MRGDSGYPTAKNPEGRWTQPFWLSRKRVERIIKTVPAYSAFTVEEIPLAAFLEEWLPTLERDGLRVGVNWSGRGAIGYDMEPQDVLRAIRAASDIANPFYQGAGEG